MNGDELRRDRRETTVGGQGEDESEWIGSADSRGPGLSNFYCLLVGCDALPEHPIYITFGGDASTSETPKAR